MAEYEMEGVTYEIPDDIQGEKLKETLTLLYERQAAERQAQQPEVPQYQPIPEDIDPDTLPTNQDWLRASRIVYEMEEGKAFEGTDGELSDYSLNLMGQFNYNLAEMGIDTAKVTSAGQEQKDAFLHLMDSYDALDSSWAGAGRFLKGIATDPTTYVGLGTLGIGLAGKVAGRAAGKEGLRQLLKAGVGTGVVAGVEGGIYATADDTMRQSISVSAGRQDEINLGQTAGAAATGFATGLVAGTAVDAAVNGTRNLLRARLLTNSSPTPATRDSAPPDSVEVSEGPPPPRDRPPEDIAETLPEPAVVQVEPQNTGVRSLPRNMEEVTEFARETADQIKNLPQKSVEAVVERLRRSELSQEEFASLERSAQIATDELRVELAKVTKEIHASPDGETLATLAARQAELETLLGPVASMDEAFSSLAGSRLRQRQEGLTSLRGQSIEDMVAAGMERQDAEEAFVALVDEALDSQKVKQVKADYDRRIEIAIDSGDMAEATRLSVMKRVETEGLADASLGNKPGLINKLNELVISNVFSPTTVMINVVPSALKTVYRPGLDFLLGNPLKASVRAEAAATYTAMAGSIKTAVKASIAALRYEQSILTRDSGRLLEGELAISGVKGGVIRTLPRILNATDEFLGQINYQGYIAGQAASKAYEEGVKKGLSGESLDASVKASVDKALKEAYTESTSRESLNTVINKGVNLGYSGEKLAEYVQKQADISGDALRHGTDEAGVNYVRDMLYKRQFTGNGFASATAKSYEEWVNKFPIIRLMGQLFFRTPVRVFEEGIRMTPGVQLIAPNFMADLAGKNGQKKQLQAQGEALMSYAFAGTVISLYAQGAIVGDGAYEDWKDGRLRTDSDLPEPYTLKMEDGSTWSFRGFDPLATPIKIITNALERYEKLEMRRQQGEFVGPRESKEVLASISVATSAVAQSIRDANLAAGANSVLTMLENIGDPEARDGAVIRFLGDKLRTLVPNTLHKVAKTNDPTIDDPATFWQMVESRALWGASLGQYGKTVPKSYDSLGNVRQIGDVGGLWNIFSQATPEERKKGRSEKELRVLRGLEAVSRQTGASFFPPTKHVLLPSVDLRQSLTEDGKETLQDRWQRYYRDLNPEDGLDIILGSELADGTMSVDGPKVQLLQNHIRKLREAAFYKLMAEESGVKEQVIREMARKAYIKAGIN